MKINDQTINSNTIYFQINYNSRRNININNNRNGNSNSNNSNSNINGNDNNNSIDNDNINNKSNNICIFLFKLNNKIFYYNEVNISYMKNKSLQNKLFLVLMNGCGMLKFR